MTIKLAGVREYCEDDNVKLVTGVGGKYYAEKGRWVIKAYNEGGHNSTEVDLLDLLGWLKEHGEEIKLPLIGI